MEGGGGSRRKGEEGREGHRGQEEWHEKDNFDPTSGKEGREKEGRIKEEKG